MRDETTAHRPQMGSLVSPDLAGLGDGGGGSHSRPHRWGVRLAWPWARPSREGYALGAIVLVGFGSALDYGHFQPLALASTVGGAFCLGLGLTGRRQHAHRLTWCGAVLLGAVGMGFVNGTGPVAWVDPLAGGVAAILVIRAKGRATRVCGCLVAAAASFVVFTKGLSWGHGSIDVFNFTQKATLALLHGRDPYSLAFSTTTPQLSSTHYPFLPGVLLLSIPGRLVGDIRASDLLAVVAVIAGVAILARRHGGIVQSWRCLALCLTLPFFPVMILFAWAEIYLMAAIVLWLVLRDKHRVSALVILGVGMATVVTPLPLLILPFLWWRRPREEILLSALVAVAICLPFVVWAGPATFARWALFLNLHLPPRFDGLDIDAAFGRLTGAWLPFWVWPLVSGGALLAVALARRRSWPSAFYLGSAFLLVVFLWAKWAFFDYYFLVAVGLILAMALESGNEQIQKPLVGDLAESGAEMRVATLAARG